jgi:hypothetical protein
VYLLQEIHGHKPDHIHDDFFYQTGMIAEKDERQVKKIDTRELYKKTLKIPHTPTLLGIIPNASVYTGCCEK